jgi:hypothetical protein
VAVSVADALATVAALQSSRHASAPRLARLFGQVAGQKAAEAKAGWSGTGRPPMLYMVEMPNGDTEQHWGAKAVAKRLGRSAAGLAVGLSHGDGVLRIATVDSRGEPAHIVVKRLGYPTISGLAE